MSYDLLLTRAHVLDPGQGTDARLDIAITGGRIVALAPELPVDGAGRVLDLSGAGRHVVPGLIDLHTHVAHGATTPGVGMACCDPDDIGVGAGVTTVLDAGSVGVANIGVLGAHVIPRAATRVITFLNIGSYAHTMPGLADVTGPDDINEKAIEASLRASPALVAGIKLRLVGPYVLEHGEDVVTRTRAVAREHGLPLMVHIGDLFGRPTDGDRMHGLTAFLLEHLDAGDILTHLCTPSIGGVMHAYEKMAPVLAEARARGVVLDAALGMGNFGYRVAREQFEAGLHPDTISSDLTAFGQTFHSLLECMAKFLAVGYGLADVVRMTTAAPASALRRSDELGAVAVGRVADLTVLDVVEGDFEFVDTVKERFTGSVALVPVQTVRAGRLHAPGWGTHPWGWLPATRGTGAGR